MKLPALDELNALWARHHAEWRDQAQVASQWREAAENLVWRTSNGPLGPRARVRSSAGRAHARR